MNDKKYTIDVQWVEDDSFEEDYYIFEHFHKALLEAKRLKANNLVTKIRIVQKKTVWEE